MKQQRASRKEFLQLGVVIVVAILSVGVAIALNSGKADQRLVGESRMIGDEVAQPTQSADGVLTTPSETPAIGDVVPLPSSKYSDLTLVRTGTAPTISSTEALDIVRNSITAPLTDQISSSFGLATFGTRDTRGIWVGDQNVRLPNGEIIDHIENRPMWIIDVGGVEGAVGGPTTRPYNHVVFAVDAMTRGVVFVWSYPGD